LFYRSNFNLLFPMALGPFDTVSVAAENDRNQFSLKIFEKI